MFGFLRKRELPTDVAALQAIINDRDVKIAELVAELEAERRVSAVKDAEIRELSNVVTRNFRRVEAETAMAMRQRADQEGQGIERLLPRNERTH